MWHYKQWLKTTNIMVEAWGVFFGAIMLFMYGLFDHEFIQFESRFGLFAQEMLRNGVSFFPTTYNKPYPDYPATQTILIYLCSLFTGKVTINTAVLPTAIASAATLSLTYLLGAMHSRAWGRYAVIFALFTYEFFASARSVALDPFVMLATVYSFYLAYTATFYQKPKRTYWIILGFVGGFLFRGPIGLVVPAAVVSGFYLLEQDYRMLWRVAMVALLLLAGGLLLFLLAASYQGGWEFAKEVIYMQVTGRIADTESARFFYWIYAPANYALSFPLAVLLLCFSASHWVQPENDKERLIRYLALWIFIIMVGLSIPGAKKIRYILPIAPAAALIAGYLFSQHPAQKVLQGIQWMMVKFCYAMPFLGLVLIPACMIAARMKSVLINAHYLSAATMLTIEAIAVFMLDKKLKNSPKHMPVILALGLAAFVTINIFMIEPINVSLNRVKPFAEQVMSNRVATQTVIFYKIEPDAEAIKLMVALDQPLKPEFIQTEQALFDVKTPAIFIAKKEDFDALPKTVTSRLKVLVEGKIGHKPCVAFEVVTR